jgi:hypothetical protein
MDLYVRRSDAEDLDIDQSFINLGYTQRGSTVINISPVVADVDCGEHAVLYNVKVRTVLSQAHSDILTILQQLKNRPQVDVLFYREAFSEFNFLQRGMSLYVDGDVDITASKLRGIPVTMTGQFSNIDEIFEPSLQTINIPIEYFLFRNTNIYPTLAVFTGADYLGNYISTTIGLRSGYFDDSSDSVSQLGFTLQGLNFKLSAAISVTSLSGREIGLALFGSNNYAYLFLVHNGTLKVWRIKISTETVTLVATYNLVHNTATESFTLMLVVNNDGTVGVYDDSTLIGTYTFSHHDTSGYYTGLAIKANNGAGSEDNRLSLLNYTSDLFIPDYLMADEFEHFTEVAYDDGEIEQE